MTNQTAATAQPSSITWPTFRAAVMEWLDQQGKTTRSENAAYDIQRAERLTHWEA